MSEDSEIDHSLINRVYYMARDGMPMTLYALLSDKTPERIDSLINQVKNKKNNNNNLLSIINFTL